MLVELTDTKGTVYWVNPVHVKALKAKKDGHTEVYLQAVTWGAPTIKVSRPIAEVAEILNSAMPELLASYPPPDDDGSGSTGTAGATIVIN